MRSELTTNEDVSPPSELAGIIDGFSPRRRPCSLNLSLSSHQALPKQLRLVIDGMPAVSAVHPDDRAAFTEAGHTAFARGEPMVVEARLQRADGVYRWFLVRSAPIRDAQGNIIRWYSVSAEIEDRKVAEADRVERPRTVSIR